MPTYEYACTRCATHIEVVQRFDDEPLTTCAVCGGTLRKVFHPAGIVFRGSGFYATDSRKPAGTGDGASGAKEASGSAKDPGKKEPGKKDSVKKDAAAKEKSA